MFVVKFVSGLAVVVLSTFVCYWFGRVIKFLCRKFCKSKLIFTEDIPLFILIVLGASACIIIIYLSAVCYMIGNALF